MMCSYLCMFAIVAKSKVPRIMLWGSRRSPTDSAAPVKKPAVRGWVAPTITFGV